MKLVSLEGGRFLLVECITPEGEFVVCAVSVSGKAQMVKEVRGNGDNGEWQFTTRVVFFLKKIEVEVLFWFGELLVADQEGEEYYFFDLN